MGRTFFEILTQTRSFLHMCRTVVCVCVCVAAGLCVAVCTPQWQMPPGPSQMMETIANCSIRQSNLANLIFSFVSHPLPPPPPHPLHTFPDLSAQQLPGRTKMQKWGGRERIYMLEIEKVKNNASFNFGKIWYYFC